MSGNTTLVMHYFTLAVNTYFEQRLMYWRNACMICLPILLFLITIALNHTSLVSTVEPQYEDHSNEYKKWSINTGEGYLVKCTPAETAGVHLSGHFNN